MPAHTGAEPTTPHATNVLLGGFLSSAAGYKPLRMAMEQASGRTTLFKSLSRDNKTSTPAHADYQYPRPVYVHAQRIAEQLTAGDVHKVRLYGHSFGAAVAIVIADAFASELEVELITLLNPACVHVDGLLSLVGRFTRKMAIAVLSTSKDRKEPEIREIFRASVPGAFDYLLSNPPLTIEEIVTIGTAPLFRQLSPKLVQRGTPLYIAYGEHDRLFTPDSIMAATAELTHGSVFMLEGIDHACQLYPAKTVAALQKHGAL